MAEGFEKTAFQEAMHESAVGKAVRGTVNEVQQTKKDYWEIRQSIEARQNLSGRGVYEHYVKNMDKIIHFMYAGKELGAVGKTLEYSKKLRVRIGAAVSSFAAATADVPVNVLTWLPRKMSPLFPVPKNPFKRMLLAKYDLKMGLEAAKSGMVRESLGVTKAVRTGTERVLQTPEVATRMVKRRVDRIVDWIKSPFAEQKAATPKARP